MSLYQQYMNYELPHMHNSGDTRADTFEDALFIQGRRIKANLEKRFPTATHDEIMTMMFGATHDS